MPSERKRPIIGSRCGSEPALRTSTAIATRRGPPSRRCSTATKSRSNSGGRLSTQK
jgi:hypothetical protein